MIRWWFWFVYGYSVILINIYLSMADKGLLGFAEGVGVGAIFGFVCWVMEKESKGDGLNE